MKTMAIVLLLAFWLAADAGRSGEKRPVNINLASVYAAEGNIHEGFLKFKELIEARSNGRITATYHPAGGLGGEREVIEGVANGTIEAGASGGLYISMFAPEWGVTEEMFIFKSPAHIRKFWDTVGQDLIKVLDERKGIVTVGMVPRGSRWITSNKPIRSPADMKGMKLRLADTPNRIKYFQEIGAIPSIIAFPELYMALKTGVVEAQENPPETIYNYKYFEAQKYLVPTRHQYTYNSYIVSRRWLNRQDPEDQKMILDAWKDASQYANDLFPDPDAAYIKMLVEEKGMIIVDKLDLDAFVKVAEKLYPEFSKKWIGGLLEKVKALE